MDARLLEAADEMAGLRGEVRQLRTESFYRKETDGRFAAVLGCTKRGARTGVCCREGGT